MSFKITQVDAFTKTPFGGNPAAVCVLSERQADEWMQKVALEMNLSETAFLLKESDGFRLRWFTPADEVKLCGHATLASAHVLWEEGFLDRATRAKFLTLSGALYASWKDGWIELDFPALPIEPMPAPKALSSAIPVTFLFAGRSSYAWFVELESENIVRSVAPDFHLLKELDRDVIITSRSSTSEYDFVSRYFAPKHGIDEDPVTGSAHSVLAPYWTQKLDMKEMRALQASPRVGFLRVTSAGDRVLMAGQAVTVMRGELVNM